MTFPRILATPCLCLLLPSGARAHLILSDATTGEPHCDSFSGTYGQNVTVEFMESGSTDTGMRSDDQ